MHRRKKIHVNESIVVKEKAKLKKNHPQHKIKVNDPDKSNMAFSRRSAIMLSASKKVLHELAIMLNSLDYFDHKCDVFIIYYKDISEDIIDLIASKNWSFNLYFEPLHVPSYAKRYNVKGTMITYRFKTIGDISSGYDSIGIFDSDMVLLSNVEDVLGAATGESIIGVNCPGCSGFSKLDPKFLNNRGRSYIRRDISSFNKIWTVPLFLNPNMHHKIFKHVTRIGEGCRSPEFPILNLVLHQLNKWQHVVQLQNYHWVISNVVWASIDIFQAAYKSSTYNTEKDTRPRIITIEQTVVRSLHGREWQKLYYQDQLKKKLVQSFHKRFRNLMYDTVPDGQYFQDRCDEFVRRKISIFTDVIVRQFLFFCFNGKILFDEYCDDMYQDKVEAIRKLKELYL